MGDSSYIDSVALRDRDQGVAWTAAGTGNLDERRYYCQNWRGDVVALTKSTGVPLEYVRYSSYGEPTVYPVADLNMDGKVDSADAAEWYDVAYGAAGTGAYSPDIDFDDAFDGSGGTDENLFYESYDANNGKSGIGKVSTDAVGNRVGYAAYQWDPTIAAFHVRYRVYKPEIGRWTRRDPAGYRDGPSVYQYASVKPTIATDVYGLDSLCEDPTCYKDAIALCDTTYNDNNANIDYARLACKASADLVYTNCLGSCVGNDDSPFYHPVCYARSIWCGQVKSSMKRTCDAVAFGLWSAEWINRFKCKAGAHAQCQSHFMSSSCPSGWKCIAGDCAANPGGPIVTPAPPGTLKPVPSPFSPCQDPRDRK